MQLRQSDEEVRTRHSVLQDVLEEWTDARLEYTNVCRVSIRVFASYMRLHNA